jgi:voltage-gated potassium channel
LLLVAVTGYGVVGYRVLEGWSLLDALYMTVITLATVGFHEVQPLDAKGQVFTISLILAGVMSLFVGLGVVTELVVSGQLARVLRRKRMDRRIGRLDQHTVICAYGRVGRAVTEELARQELPFVVVERQEALIQTLEERGMPYIAGDPTAEEVLERAGIQRARALVCAVDSDAANVYITLTARALNAHLVIAARASNPTSVDTLVRAGADQVVSPYLLSGRRMAFLAQHPAVVDFLDLMSIVPDLRLEQILCGRARCWTAPRSQRRPPPIGTPPSWRSGGPVESRSPTPARRSGWPSATASSCWAPCPPSMPWGASACLAISPMSTVWTDGQLTRGRRCLTSDRS